MSNRLPQWIEFGAFTLALLAGTVNAVGLLGFQHQSVSHLSGTVTLLGTELVSQSAAVLHLLAVVVSFLFGSAISGFILSSSTLKLGRHYDSLLIIEGFMLLCAVFFLNDHSTIGHYFASAACGLQNALATTYSSAIVRTTHVTGIFTDLGIMIGSRLRGENFEKRKALLFLLIIIGFLSGGVIGAMLFAAYEFYALVFPSAICFVLAVLYKIYALKTKASA